MQPQSTNSTRRFFLHYVEMVAAMFIGIFALSKPLQRAGHEHIE